MKMYWFLICAIFFNYHSNLVCSYSDFLNHHRNLGCSEADISRVVELFSQLSDRDVKEIFLGAFLRQATTVGYPFAKLETNVAPDTRKSYIAYGVDPRALNDIVEVPLTSPIFAKSFNRSMTHYVENSGFSKIQKTGLYLLLTGKISGNIQLTRNEARGGVDSVVFIK